MLHLVVAIFMAAPASTAETGAGHVVPVKDQVRFAVLGRLDGPYTPIAPPSPIGMQPLKPPGGCPPKCIEILPVSAVKLEQLGVLFRPGKDARLERLSVLVLDQTGSKLVVGTDARCERCDATLPEQAKGGHLFRLDSEAIKALGAALEQHPGGLRLHVSGKGDYKLELVRIE